MNDRTLRNIIAVLVVLIVVALASTAFVMMGRNTGTATATGSPIAAGSPSESVTPSEASAAPSETPAVSASPTPPPAPVATATILDLKLDATDDPAGVDRVITFKSDGPGTVKAKLTSISPQGLTHMCLLLGKKDVTCKDLASGTFTGQTSQNRATWHVSLRGVGLFAPVVKLRVTFQALAPSVKIANARFDGTAFPDTNGIQVRFTARSDGDAHLVADWGGHPFIYEVDLFDETNGSGDQTLAGQGPSTNVDQSFPVASGVWRLVLQNAEVGFGTTGLTATVSWP